MLTKRIIPCLDIKNGRTVKGVNFINLIVAGDPVALAKQYANLGADEFLGTKHVVVTMAFTKDESSILSTSKNLTKACQTLAGFFIIVSFLRCPSKHPPGLTH